MKTNLKKITLNEFVALFINYPQSVSEFYRLSHNDKCGNCISLLFNPHRLNTRTTFADGRSIFESLQDDSVLDGLARLWLYNIEHNVNNAFYQTIQRGFNGIQYVNEFPPFVARTIYNKYKKEHSDIYTILDHCCGWGGRMIGAASLGKCHYYGYEPSTETFNGLLKLGEFLQSLNPDFNFTIYNKPYEDCYKLSDVKYDIALTSPPCFNTELYSDEITNSCNKYNQFELWIEKFFTPLIKNTIDNLYDDSIFVLNISSRKYPLYDNAKKICDTYGYNIIEIPSYLSGGSEKFYIISKSAIFSKTNKLF